AESPESITVDGNKAVTAHFGTTSNTRTLALNITGGTGTISYSYLGGTVHGTVSVNTTITSPSDQTVLLEAAGTGTDAFQYWTGDLTTAQYQASVSFSTVGKTVTAHFGPSVDTKTLTLNKAGGTGNISYSYYSGTVHGTILSADLNRVITVPVGQAVSLTGTGTGTDVFLSWTGGLVSTVSPDSITVDGNKIVTANFGSPVATKTLTFKLSGAGIITYSYVNGTTITDTVSVTNTSITVPQGTVVTLDAVGVSPSAFRYWTTDLHTAQHNDSITVSANKTVTANFGPASATYNLDLNLIGGDGEISYNYSHAGNSVFGVVSLNTPISVPDGTTVSLRGEGTGSYAFQYWTGHVISAYASSSLTVSGLDAVANANFGLAADTKYLTVNISGPGVASYSYTHGGNTIFGMVTAPTLSAPINTVVSLTATGPNPTWTGGVDVVGSTTSATSTLTGNKTVNVVFIAAAVMYTVTAAPDTGSTITPSGPIPVAEGGNVTLVFTAGPGYKIVNVTIDGLSNPSVAELGSYTFSNVDGNHTFSTTVIPAAPTGDRDPIGGDNSDNSVNPGNEKKGARKLFGGSDTATILAIIFAILAGFAIFWFIFGPGRVFKVIKVSSDVAIIGKDRARYKRAYLFNTDGDAKVRYRVGKDGDWEVPARTDSGYEIPKEDVVGEITIEAE
ncbi:MAG: hypothetical protein LBT41_05750, partial [Candidatus Methanoplasma sp.]|nr:hypothetical protein [Candidatus Methanoplasma sp.]